MEKKVFSVFQCCNLLKTVHNVHFILNRQHIKKLDIQSASNMISSLFMEKKVFLYFIKHDLELVYGKKSFSVFQCCNLLKTVHNVHLILNRQHIKKLDIQSASTWFRACLWEKTFFCISMLQLAENCPQCSFHLK